MAKYVIQSKRGAPPQGAYSQGWRAGDFIFVTGTGPIDPATGKLAGDTIERQTEQTIDNMLSILEADGASLADVVKVNVYLTDMANYSKMNIMYAEQFGTHKPARTTVAVAGLPLGALFEIECIAEYKNK